MQKYYMNSNMQDSGDFEVHTTGCSHGADEDNRLYLGDYYSCGPAVQEAIRLYASKVTELGGKINGCYWCCNTCHTG